MLFKVSSILPLLCMAAYLHLALLLPIRPHIERHSRGTTTEGNTTTSGRNNASAANGTSQFDCYYADACNVTLECSPDVPSLRQKLVDRASLDRGLNILKDYSTGLFNSMDRTCSQPVTHGGLQSFFMFTAPLIEANQHLADGASVLRAYTNHVATIIETNLTHSTEELAKAITLYQILTGVLNDHKKVLEPFCPCSDSKECAEILPMRVNEVTDCDDHLANAGYYIGVSLRPVTMTWMSWSMWQMYNNPSESKTTTDFSEEEWNTKHLSCNVTV